MLRTRSLRAAAIAAVFVLGARGAFGGDAPRPASLTAEDRAFFAWWDGLGYPDLAKTPFVRVWSGWWEQTGNADPVQTADGAFLLEDRGDSFTVFRTDLSTDRLKKTGSDAKPWQRVAFEKTDLAEFVRQGTATLAKEGPEIPWYDKSDPFGAHRWAIPNQAFRIAVLARACAARGHEDLAAELCRRARFEETRPRMTEQWGRDDSKALAPWSAVESSLRREAWVVLEGAFGDAELTWEDLLARTERYARAFAPADLTADDGMVATLRSMVADAKARCEQPAKPWEQQTPDERLATLIRDLQEEGLDPRREKEPVRVSDRLVEMGLVAVPALIEALDDVRFTRSLLMHQTYKGQFRESYELLRVGDLAWQTLDRIAGGSLSSRPVGGGPTSGQPTRRRAAQEWFETVSRRGEAALLAEQVAGGGREAHESARRLAAIDSVAAVKALETGILAAEDRGGTRFNLISVLSGVAGEVATAALLRLLEALRDSESGLRVARALWDRGRREGLDDMVRRWTALAASKPEHRGQRFTFGSFSTDELVENLAATRDLEAVRALADGLAARSPGERVEVIGAFAPGFHFWAGEKAPPPTVEVEKAIEALVADRLEDGDRVKGLHLGSEPIGDEPIVGEIAADVLSKRYPKAWPFDRLGTPAQREAERIAMANRWRAAHGKPPLPPPARRAAPTPIALDAIRADVERATSPDEAVRAPALAAIEAKGLAAVPALREALSRIPADRAGRASLETLARRLSFVVTETVVDDKARPVPDSFREAVAATKGKPFTGEAWFALWRAFLASDPTPGTELFLRIERESAEAGVRVVARAAASKARKNDDPGVSFDLPSIRRGSGSRNGGVGWLPREVAMTSWKGEGLQDDIDATPFDDLFEAEGRVEWQR